MTECWWEAMMVHVGAETFRSKAAGGGPIRLRSGQVRATRPALHVPKTGENGGCAEKLSTGLEGLIPGKLLC